MPKVSAIFHNFNAGEWSPLMYGRTDLEKHRNAMAVCKNMIPLVQGPATRRAGTKFASEVKDSTKATRLIPFEFSVTQAYILEFGDQYIRFYKDNGSITLTAQNITNITQANPAVVTYAGADTYANGDHVNISGVVGMTQVNNRRFTVANVNAGANTFELSGVNSTGYTAYSSGGTVAEIYEISTPYLEADLFQLKVTQSADVLYIAHPSYAPRKLTRTAHTTWTLSVIDFLDGPYLPINTTATTLTPSATSGAGITITASAVTGINGGAGFRAQDVGRLIRIKHGSTWGYAKITIVGGTTSVTADVVSAFGATTGSVDWRLGLWNSVDGYPSCVTFFEDRLFWAGGVNYPQRLDGSKTGDYENMAPTSTAGVVANDNAVSVTLNASDVNVIRWLIDDEKGLLAGTVGGEWIIRASSTSEALTPTNIQAKRSTTNGSANIQPVRAGKAAIYIQRSARTVHELAYVFEVDGFRSPDMTFVSEHITRGGVKQMDYQQEPQRIVWVVRNDGVLLGLTYEREQEVVGWHRHELGGYSNAGHTAAAKIESVAVIPAMDGSRDEVWVVVNRYINGGTKRYVEYLTKLWEEDDDQEDAFFVDCGLTYDGASATTITGLYHLAGETISALVDGAVHPNVTVSATGTVTLTRAGSVVQLGYSYNSDGQTLRIEAGAADGTAQGKPKRIHNVTFRLFDTLGIQVGRDFDNLDRLVFRTSSDNAGEAPPLFSGDKFTEWEGDYETEGYICWRFDQPLPGTVLAIMPQLITQDRG